jgi:hypothetical protein
MSFCAGEVDMSETITSITCNGCGKKYKWKPQLAGKRVKCACGGIIAVPQAEVADEPDDLYALAEDAAKKLQSAESESATIAPPQEPVLGSPALATVKPGLAAAGVKDPLPLVYRRRGLSEEPKVERPPSALQNYILPAAMIALGLCLSFVEGMGRDERVLNAGQVVITIICNLALVIGAIFLASAIAGVALDDPMHVTILKVCAIGLLPGAIAGIIGNQIGGINGDIVGPLVSVALLLGSFFLLFRMAVQDMVICVMLVWNIRSAVMYAMWRAEGIIGGHDI